MSKPSTVRWPAVTTEQLREMKAAGMFSTTTAGVALAVDKMHEAWVQDGRPNYKVLVAQAEADRLNHKEKK